MPYKPNAKCLLLIRLKLAPIYRFDDSHLFRLDWADCPPFSLFSPLSLSLCLHFFPIFSLSLSFYQCLAFVLLRHLSNIPSSLDIFFSYFAVAILDNRRKQPATIKPKLEYPSPKQIGYNQFMIMLGAPSVVFTIVLPAKTLTVKLIWSIGKRFGIAALLSIISASVSPPSAEFFCNSVQPKSIINICSAMQFLLRCRVHAVQARALYVVGGKLCDAMRFGLCWLSTIISAFLSPLSRILCILCNGRHLTFRIISALGGRRTENALACIISIRI